MSGHRPWSEIKRKEIAPDLQEMMERYYNHWWWRLVRRYDRWKERRKK